MTTPSITATARLVARLVAHRPTQGHEIADLIRDVHVTLAGLDGREQPAVERAAPRLAAKAERRRLRSPKLPPPAPSAEAPPPPPAPKLVRRAEIAATPQANTAAWSTSPILRGVVKWYDPRTGKGALRLPGFSGDIPLDAQLLTESGIARLFKGQEVEATLAHGGAAPQLRRLSVPGTAAPNPVGGGVVRSRHAKPVVVELKREGLRRVAARAEAEQLLGSGRGR